MSTTTATTTLRLTSRGRRVLAGLVALPAALGIWAVASAAAPADASSAIATELPSVTVHAGDTLWSIAEDHAAGRDVRDVMDDIERLNALSGSGVEPGQHLLLPSGS